MCVVPRLVPLTRRTSSSVNVAVYTGAVVTMLNALRLYSIDPPCRI